MSGSETDEELQRYLQQEDSGSPSPIVKKKSTRAEVDAGRTKRSSSAASMSVVAAAQKLLAASGRGRATTKDKEMDKERTAYGKTKSKSKSKSKSTTQLDEDESSADPYAFELNASSALIQEDEEKEKKKKQKAKAKEKKYNEAKKKTGSLPRKESMTIEERMAAILKRNGSLEMTTVPQEPTKSEKQETSRSGDDDDATEKKPAAPPDTHSKSMVEKRENVTSEAESSKLSFSDSLGMESADFEVGVHARRNLDHSRLSLSSLNSEKFAANIDAVDKSGLATPSRYEQLSNAEGFVVNDREYTEMAEYENDDFELDQTNEDKDACMETSTGESPSTHFDNDTAFAAELKKIQELLLPEPTPVTLPIDSKSAFPETQSVPAEIENAADLGVFGYDDEDFETEETGTATARDFVENEKVEAASVATSIPQHDGEYEDEEFETSTQVVEQAVHEDKQGAPAETVFTPFEVSSHELRVYTDTTQAVADEQASTLNNIDNKLDSPQSPTGAYEAEKRQQPAQDIEIPQQRSGPGESLRIVTEQSVRVPLTSVSPPRSPPPPPPPEEEPDDKKSLTYLQTRVVREEVSTREERLQHVQNQIASLRFVKQNTKAEVAPLPFPPQMESNDTEMAHDIEEIALLVEKTRRSRQERKSIEGVRPSSAKESALSLRLQQAQRSILQVKHHLRQLASDDESSPKVNFPPETEAVADIVDCTTAPDVVVSSPKADKKIIQAYSKLQKEAETQERLIQAYQRESEAMMRQMKELRSVTQVDLYQENIALKAKIAEIGSKIDGDEVHQTRSGAGEKFQLHAAVEARLQAEAQLQSLMEEMNNLRQAHQDKINELQLELEKTRKAKRDLECRYEGIDPDKVQNEYRLMKDMEQEMQQQNMDHERAIRALQKKLDWYMENQRLLDQQDKEMSTLRAENQRLTSELQQSPLKQKTNVMTPSKRSPSDIRKIHELEAQLESMQEAIRKRHPDSLVNLIVASRKVEEEARVQALKQEYESQIESVQRSHEATKLKLKSLRQQHEKLSRQYQEQIRQLEDRLAKFGTSAMRENVSTKSSKQITRNDLQRVRAFYIDKIKKLEKTWETKLQSLKRNQAGIERTTTTKLPSADQTKPSIDLAHRLKVKDAELKKLQAKVEQNASAPNSSQLIQQINGLERELKASEEARHQMLESLTAAQTSIGVEQMSLEASNRIRAEVERSLMETFNTQETLSRQELKEAHERIATLQHQVDELSITRQQYAYIEKQLDDRSKEVQRLQDQIAVCSQEQQRGQERLFETEKEKYRLQEQAARLPILENELARVQEEANIPQTPSMLAFRSLELKVETLTQKHQLREQELQILLQHASQSSRLERLNTQRMCQNAIALKNAEITRFKKQLDELMNELEALRLATSHY